MTRRRLFWLWLPLALSFTLMNLEGPSVQASIAHLTDPERNLAAFGLVLSISLIIESPVIMLLSTAIALTTDTHSYQLLRRFVIMLIFTLTLLTALVAWTPVYDLIVTGILGIPSDITDVALPAFRIMLFWTAAIGWRRFYQGLLIRQGQTSRVSFSTGIRLFSTIVTAVLLVMWNRLSGAQVGACALMAGVLSEALAVHLFAMSMVRQTYTLQTRPSQHPLTTGGILRFHLPLATTSLLTLVVQPITAAALARMVLPQLTLAVWPVVFSTLMVLRGWGMALQETSVAQATQPDAQKPLRDFTWIVAGVTTLAIVVLGYTPLIKLYLRDVIGLDASLWSNVQLGVQIGVLLPALTSLISWLRGVLVAVRRTSTIYQGMAVNLLVNATILVGGASLHLPGIPVASTGLVLSIGAEYLFLRWRYAGLTQNRTSPMLAEATAAS
ncbi:MAG: hypothetical protein NVS4B8_02840 [Herpetosiphon sp.]